MAYKTAIKPSLRDYIPKKELLLESAVKIFIQGIKLLPHK
jgi:hypothetical protein